MLNTMRVLLFSPLWLAFVATAWEIGQTAETTSGSIKGHASSWKPEISEYLGIPFAIPPVGSLRFEAPRPYEGNGTIIADRYSADCPTNTNSIAEALRGAFANNSGLATFANEFLQIGHNFSDDCLTLNVWTKPQIGDKKKAVILYFYGGGYWLGSTNNKQYDGARIVEEEDVVVVTANYRISLFGFPNAPGLLDQNLGLLDTRLAVSWVHDNIAVFGGDPDRITLFGFSAGGVSVDLYAYGQSQNPTSPPVNGYISQSGTASLGLGTHDTNNTAWYSISTAVGCGGPETSSTTVECMRRKPLDDLLKILDTSTNASGLLASAFTPVVDERVFFSNISGRAEAGQFARRPMLVGNSDNEGGIANIDGGEFFKRFFGVGANAEVLNTAMTCGSRKSAVTRKAAGVKVWRYRYMGDWPNQFIAAGAGAYHGSENPMVFGSSEHYRNMSDTLEEAVVSKEMRHAWAVFAKDPDSGLTNLGWPNYDESKPSLIRFGFQNKSAISLANNNLYDNAKKCAQIGL